MREESCTKVLPVSASADDDGDGLGILLHDFTMLRLPEQRKGDDGAVLPGRDLHFPDELIVWILVVDSPSSGHDDFIAQRVVLQTAFGRKLRPFTGNAQFHGMFAFCQGAPGFFEPTVRS